MSQRTQADQLPASFNKEIRVIDSLQGRSDFATWAARAKKALEQYDLEDLIDSGIIRPANIHQKYKTWRQLSKAISRWLTTIIYNNIFKTLHSSNL